MTGKGDRLSKHVVLGSYIGIFVGMKVSTCLPIELEQNNMLQSLLRMLTPHSGLFQVPDKQSWGRLHVVQRGVTLKPERAELWR